MDNLYNILLMVKKRPRMYLKRVSLKYLSVFINGCIACMNDHESGMAKLFYSNFQVFIKDKYNVNFDKHWSDIIEFYCVDEDKAFYKFFELVDEYIESCNK